MRIKKILAIVMVAIMLVGCGGVESKPQTSEKKEDKMEAVVKDIAESGGEDESHKDTTEGAVEAETAEPTPTETATPTETPKTETKSTQQKTEMKKKTEAVAPAVTAPVVSEPIAKPAPEVKECEHLYEPVEWEEYTGIRKMVWGCNGCGFPLFTINSETRDAVNIEDLYFHRECYSEKLGMMCPKPCGWHSEEYYQGYCYRCHGETQLRACTYFYKRAEYCVKNAGDLGEYEKVEEGHAYIKSCSCGQNILMAGGEKGGLMLKKEVCKYCGDEKTYPEK